MMRDLILTARANRIARRTVSRWEERNNCAGLAKALPKIFVKHTRRGRTNFNRREAITVPAWAYQKYGKHYFRYYVLHETAHALALVTLKDGHGHTAGFHKIENALCAEWKLELHKTTSYAKSIDYRGQEVFTKS